MVVWCAGVDGCTLFLRSMAYRMWSRSSSRIRRGMVTSAGAAVAACALVDDPLLWRKTRARGFVPSTAVMEPISSPFLWKELDEGIERRRQSQIQLEEFMVQMQQHVRFCQHQSPDPDACLATLKERVDRESNDIIYGIKNAQTKRSEYAAKYGCAAWTEEALDTLAELAPLIELGAGAGQWQRALHQKHFPRAQMISFDNGSSVAPPADGLPNEVLPGDETELVKAVHSHRTLFLCYPPLDADSRLAINALRAYRGDRMVYVGEGRGGANAGNAFFEKLEREWVVEKTIALNPFPTNHERMFVLSRRPKALILSEPRPVKEGDPIPDFQTFLKTIEHGTHAITFYGQWCHFSRVFVGYDKATGSFSDTGERCTLDRLVEDNPSVRFHLVHEPSNPWVKRTFPRIPGYPITLLFKNGVNIGSIVGAQPIEECQKSIDTGFDL